LFNQHYDTLYKIVDIDACFKAGTYKGKLLRISKE